MIKKYDRILGLQQHLHTGGSAFLFGPRQVGKSTLVRDQFSNGPIINLLKSEEYLSLSADPSRLRTIVDPGKITVIDEIQRIPELLNEVHYLIEDRGARFLMTGSSARKLRKGGVNLLGGRAYTFRLHPFSLMELADDFELERAIQRGTIPSVWLSEDPDARLAAYASNYLEQEIVAEAAVRNVASFRRFLGFAALQSGKQLNYTKLSSDAQVKPTTLREHVEILIDSLIASRVEPWRRGKRRKPVASEKLYFFDTGVTRILQERSNYAPNSEEYGSAFETLIFHEIRCYVDYVSREPVYYWRTTTDLEVDFIIGDRLALEVKASQSINDKDLRGLRAIASEGTFEGRILICREPHPRKTDDGIYILPLPEFVQRLWSGYTW